MNPYNISTNYTAIRYSVESLFDAIETLDPDLSPFIDSGETIRLMLADFFYGDILKPHGNIFRDTSDRTIVFKPGTKRADVEKDTAEQVFTQACGIFWDLSDYLYNDVLKATAGYTHPANECFYQFSPEEKALNVYLPVRDGLNVMSSTFPAASVIHACYATLPHFLRTIISGFLAVPKEESDGKAKNTVSLIVPEALPESKEDKAS